MSPPNDETGPSAERPVNTGTGVDAETHSSVEYAVKALGELVNLAFSDALRLDQLARLIVKAFGNIGFGDRIDLADQHPKLVEALILLENAIDRVDER